ncbi:hypothetical protein L596_027455 [Steinernema carpocapsae]|uniref:Uncharacterized protein n=1 Tax=Steinernema carpocapsae TaxID=34508 RepID=A0A4U5LVI7_STECR|nr:hypothetical protein L596_027455 [Steinernema carpocapsae]
MAINPSNVLQLLAMRFPGHQSTEDYSIFEEETANGIFDSLEDIMEDREDRLFKAFPEDDDAAEVSNESENSEDDTPLERFYITASRCPRSSRSGLCASINCP